MTLDDLQTLCEEGTKNHIEQNIERGYREVALDKCLRANGVGYASLIAEQVKYLQRSQKKLPSYYGARCIVVGKSYEQSSSEDVAATKSFCGESLLDLTCGLGVDTFAMSKRFKRVVTIERDELFAAVAKENFKRLGAENIEVVNSSAEDFLASCAEKGERFGVIYCDPDRRGADGKKKVVLEDCSPNMVALKGHIAEICDLLVIKCSPLFDVDEAFRLFGEENTAVEVVSSGDECKEVVIYTGPKAEHKGEIGATAVGQGSLWRAAGCCSEMPKGGFRAEGYKYLVIPDVAMQKGRMARAVLGEECDIWSDNGFGFATEMPSSDTLGRQYEIEAIYRYEPKRVKRALKDLGIAKAEILKREFAYSTEQVAKRLGLKGGGARKIAVTTVLSENYVVILK